MPNRPKELPELSGFSPRIAATPVARLASGAAPEAFDGDRRAARCRTKRRAGDGASAGALAASCAPALEGGERGGDFVVARRSRNRELPRFGPPVGVCACESGVERPHRPGVASAGLEAVVPRWRPARRRSCDHPRPNELRLAAAVEPEHRELIAGRTRLCAPREGRAGAGRLNRTGGLAGRNGDQRRARPGDARSGQERCGECGTDGAAEESEFVHTGINAMTGQNPGISATARRSAVRRPRTARAGRPRGRRRG